MPGDGWMPEIVVGVDFGMTCTGSLNISCDPIVSFLGSIDKIIAAAHN